MKEVIGYKPFPYQKAVHDLLDEHPYDSIIVVKSKRQIGKSIMLENELLRHSINYGRQDSVLISPTYKQGAKVFREIVRAAAGTPILKHANASDLILTTLNGSTITILSAESRENIRGFTVTKHGLLCIDEAAYIPDAVIEAALPFVDANRADIIMTSTPLFKAGYFYDFFTKGMRGEMNCYSVDVCDYDTSALLSPEKLEFYRKTLSTNIFLTDYLGQWIEAKGTVFGDFAPCITKLIPNGECEVMGIDWATGSNNDETAVSLFNSDKQMIRLEHFSDKDSTETIDIIVNLIDMYKPKRVVLEMNSIGKVYCDMLKKELKRIHSQSIVEEFYTTNDTKRDIIENLQVMIAQRAITLLDDPVLKLEFASYETKRTPTGKITYGNSSDSLHDDIVMSVALAMSNSKKTYVVV